MIDTLFNLTAYKENTHSRCKDDLLFDWFAYDQTSKYVVNLSYAKQLNPNM